MSLLSAMQKDSRHAWRLIWVLYFIPGAMPSWPTTPLEDHFFPCVTLWFTGMMDFFNFFFKKHFYDVIILWLERGNLPLWCCLSNPWPTGKIFRKASYFINFPILDPYFLNFHILRCQWYGLCRVYQRRFGLWKILEKNDSLFKMLNN